MSHSTHYTYGYTASDETVKDHPESERKLSAATSLTTLSSEQQVIYIYIYIYIYKPSHIQDCTTVTLAIQLYGWIVQKYSKINMLLRFSPE